MQKSLFLLVLTTLWLSCNQTPTHKAPTTEAPQAILTSLLGKPLYEPERSPSAQHRLDSNLQVARQNYEANPKLEENIIWLGRRTAYLSHYQKAIDIYTQGLEVFPNSAKLYRHRGHRYISLRKFDQAITDFEVAVKLIKDQEDEIEPDGIPNRLNQPLSSLHFNIWYHLGLAHYLAGDFAKAEEAFRVCMELSSNPDLLCATSDWLYMALRRSGNKAEAEKLLAAITPDMNMIENEAYHKRLLMYKGEVSVEDLLEVGEAVADRDLALATQGYGVGNWYLYHDEEAKAVGIFEQVVAGQQWAAFGYIAAEVDLGRLQK